MVKPELGMPSASLSSVGFVLQSKQIQRPYRAQHALPGYRIPHEASMSSEDLHAWHFIDVSTLRQGMLYGSLSNTTTATSNILQVNADFLLPVNSWYTLSAQ